jgi:hypothetical protein
MGDMGGGNLFMIKKKNKIKKGEKKNPNKTGGVKMKRAREEKLITVPWNNMKERDVKRLVAVRTGVARGAVSLLCMDETPVQDGQAFEAGVQLRYECAEKSGSFFELLRQVRESLSEECLGTLVHVSREECVFTYDRFDLDGEFQSFGLCPFCKKLHNATSTRVSVKPLEGLVVAVCSTESGAENHLLLPEDLMASLSTFWLGHSQWLSNEPVPTSLAMHTHGLSMGGEVEVHRQARPPSEWQFLIECAEPLCRYPIDVFNSKVLACTVCYSPLDVEAEFLYGQVIGALKGVTLDERVTLMKKCNCGELWKNSVDRMTCINCAKKLDTASLQHLLQKFRNRAFLQPWERALQKREVDLEFLNQCTAVICGTCDTGFVRLAEYVKCRGLVKCKQGHSLQRLVLRGVKQESSVVSLVDNCYRSSVPEKPCWLCGVGNCKTCPNSEGLSVLGLYCRSCDSVRVSGMVVEGDLRNCWSCKSSIFESEDERSIYASCFGIGGFVPTLDWIISLAVNKDSLEEEFAFLEGEIPVMMDDVGNKQKLPPIVGKENFRVRNGAFYWKNEQGKVCGCGNFVVHGHGRLSVKGLRKKGEEEKVVIELNKNREPLIVSTKDLDSISSLLSCLNGLVDTLGLECTEVLAGNVLCEWTKRSCMSSSYFVQLPRIGTCSSPIAGKFFCLLNGLQWNRESGVRVSWKESHVLVEKSRLVLADDNVADSVVGLQKIHAWVRHVWGGYNVAQVLAAFGYGVMSLYRSARQKGTSTDFPSCWMFSTDPGSGKSSVAGMVLSLFGLSEEACVKTISDAALYQKMDLLQDCVIVIDDKEVDAKGRASCAKLYEMAHNLFDSKPWERDRGVKLNVRCGSIFCTNFVPPRLSSAQYRRLLILPFQKAMGRSAAEQYDMNELDDIKMDAVGGLSALLNGIKIDTHEEGRLQKKYINSESSIHPDSASWYACWLYFTMKYANVVLQMSEEEVWERFRSDVLGSSALKRACGACVSLGEIGKVDAIQDPFVTLQNLKLRNVDLPLNLVGNGCEKAVLVLKSSEPPLLALFDGKYVLRSALCYRKSSVAGDIYLICCTSELDKVNDACMLFYERVDASVVAVAAAAEVRKVLRREIRELGEIEENVKAKWGDQVIEDLHLVQGKEDGIWYWIGAELIKKKNSALREYTALGQSVKNNTDTFETVALHAKLTQFVKNGKKVFKGTGEVAILVRADNPELLKILKKQNSE